MRYQVYSRAGAGAGEAYLAHEEGSIWLDDRGHSATGKRHGRKAPSETSI